MATHRHPPVLWPTPHVLPGLPQPLRDSSQGSGIAWIIDSLWRQAPDGAIVCIDIDPKLVTAISADDQTAAEQLVLAQAPTLVGTAFSAHPLPQCPQCGGLLVARVSSAGNTQGEIYNHHPHHPWACLACRSDSGRFASVKVPRATPASAHQRLALEGRWEEAFAQGGWRGIR